MRQLRFLAYFPILVLCALGGTHALPAAASAPVARGSVPVTLYPSDAAGNRLPGPAYWTETATPGTTLNLYTTVGNPGKTKTAFQLLPVDAFNSLYGGLSYTLPNQPLRAAGTWVRLPGTRYTIAPDKGFVLAFTVHIPRGTKPGQYVAGIAASPPPTARSGGSIGIQVQLRIAIPIVITIPGSPVYRFSVRRVGTRIQGNATVITIHLLNSGNMLLKGTGHLWVWRYGLSSALLSAPISVGTTVPHLPVLYLVKLGPHPVTTTYTYKLLLTWSGGRLMTRGKFIIRRSR